MQHDTRNRESGQALVMTTLSLVAMFGLLGLAVDIGWMHFRAEAAQTAADAAASAAAQAALASSGGSITCGSNNVECQSTTACPNPIPSSPVKDTDIACAYAQSNGFALTTGGRQNVTVASGTGSVPTASGVSVNYWVTVRVAETIPQFFSAVLGNETGTVSAVATAAITGSSASSCIYVLSPSLKSAFSATNGASVNASCGIFIDSNNSNAMTVSGGTTVNAPTIQVVGGCSITGGSTVSPTPTSGAASVADPFASLPAPTYSGCNYTNESVGGGKTVTLSPGVYCNGISLAGGSTVTFQPGVYILNGGGLTLAGGTTVSGSGVSFFNTANGYTYGPLSISNGATATLSAPTSGTYEGILFFQDRNISSSAVNVVTGGASEQLTGSLYFPTTSLSYSGGSSTTVTAIVAQSVTFSGGSSFAEDPTGTKTGLGQQIASLIQ